jgi:hypothetical protein
MATERGGHQARIQDSRHQKPVSARRRLRHQARQLSHDSCLSTS